MTVVVGAGAGVPPVVDSTELPWGAVVGTDVDVSSPPALGVVLVAAGSSVAAGAVGCAASSPAGGAVLTGVGAGVLG